MFKDSPCFRSLRESISPGGIKRNFLRSVVLSCTALKILLENSGFTSGASGAVSLAFKL